MGQVLGSHHSVVPCVDGPLLLRLSRGVPPGLKNATNMFNFVYSEAVSSFEQQVEERTTLLRAWSPLSHKWLSTAVT
eukprot:10675032-Alexandrium_andersonii.AAC.1